MGQVNYIYYAGTGLLHTVTGSDSVQYAKCSSYKPTGKMGKIEHENNTSTTYSYGTLSTRLLGIVIAGPSGESENYLQSKSYTYTPAGDIETIFDEMNGITYTYAYDKLYRLKTETNTGTYDPVSYTYNAIGNIMTRTVGTDTFSYSYDPNHKHAVKTITLNSLPYNYAYDANGNMTGGPDFTDLTEVATRTISYNSDNMPTHIEHVKGGNTVTTDFVYDGEGFRVRKTVQDGSSTFYIGDHFEVKDGVATKYVFAGNLRVAKVEASATLYFHKDHLGSSTAITDVNGSARETTEYMPFGGVRDHTGTVQSSYRCTDQELDSGIGLYNYGARLYDPIIGRFISADTIVQNLTDPQTLNRYAYVRNNPLVYIDPSGHFFHSIIGAIVGAVIGGVTAAITGDNIWQGMLVGAISGALMGAGTGLAFQSIEYEMGGFLCQEFIYSSGQQAAILGLSGAASGAASGGLYASMNGGDVGSGILRGALSGAAIGVGSTLFPAAGFELFDQSAAGTVANRLVRSSLIGGGYGAAHAGITGGDIGHGAASGALGWVAGEAGNILIGHGLGLAMTGKGPKYRNGAFYYYPKGQVPFTVGGIIIGDASMLRGWNYMNGRPYPQYSVDQHERAHFPQQMALSVSYIPVHLMSQGDGGCPDRPRLY